MNQKISHRYQKALVTVAMGFRTEEDIKKNGLYRFIKQEKKELIEHISLLISKNNSNFRCVITVDKSGDIEEAKDPLQNYTTEENINLISKIFNINNLNEFIKKFVFDEKYSNNKNLIKNSVNFYSLYDGNYEQIKTLLSVKPSLINKEYKNKTPLTLRCYKIDKELPKIISLFLNYKADINGNNDDSPLNALLSNINKDETIQIEKNETDTTPEYDPSKDVNEMTDDELENLL